MAEVTCSALDQVNELINDYQDIIDGGGDRDEQLASALNEVAELAGRNTDEARSDFCSDFTRKYGDTTFGKLRAWAGGVDSGFDLAKQMVKHIVENVPSIHVVDHGKRFGLVTITHRQTGKLYVVPFAEGEEDKAFRLLKIAADKLDPRAGSWLRDSIVLSNNG